MRLSVPVRTAAAGVLAALLVAGCGGGGSSSSSGSGQSYSVSVAVSGLSGTVGVAMGGNTLTFTSDGTNSFSNQVAAGNTYTVTVSIQPSTQYCTVSNGTAVIHAAVTVDVSCNASAGGIWQATNQNGNNTTDTYVAMADEQGDFWLLDTNTNDTDSSVNYAYVYGGNLTVNGTTVSGSDTGEALTGTYSDGSSYGSGTMSGTVDARNTLTLTSTFKTTPSSGTPVQVQLPQTPLVLAYDSLYSQGSSLAAVAGTYLQSSLTLTISSGGALQARDSLSGCMLMGTVTPIVSDYDMYEVSYTVSSCALGVNNPSEGLTFDGIGTFEPGTPAQFIAVQAASLTTGYVYSALNLVKQ